MVRTTSLTNSSAILAVAVIVLGMFTHNVGILIMGAPFIFYAAYAIASYPKKLNYKPPRKLFNIRLDENKTSEVPAGIDPVLPLVTVSWPYSKIGWANPTFGDLTDVGKPRNLQITPIRWGTHQLGPATVVQSDIWGAWRLLEEHGPKYMVRVEPASTPLINTAGLKNPRGLSGSHRSSQVGEGTDLAKIRPYQVGDDLRRVNWKVTARTQQLHVTQSQSEKDATVYVIMDSSQEISATNFMPTSSLDLAISASMSILRHYLAAGDRVALVDLANCFPPLLPGSGAAQAKRALQQISKIDRDEVKPWLARYTHLTSGNLVFICSNLLSQFTLDEILRLTQLGTQVIVVDCFPPLEENVSTNKEQVQHQQSLRLLKLQRTPTIAGFQRIGIPVVPWTGPASLAGVLLSMESSRSAARKVRR